jgi:hypothetical protein
MTHVSGALIRRRRFCSFLGKIAKVAEEKLMMILRLE